MSSNDKGAFEKSEYGHAEQKVSILFSKIKTEGVGGIVEKDAILERLMVSAEAGSRVRLFAPITTFVVSILTVCYALFDGYYTLVAYNATLSDAVAPALEKAAWALSPSQEALLVITSLAFMCMIFSVMATAAGAIVFQLYESICNAPKRTGSSI